MTHRWFRSGYVLGLILVMFIATAQAQDGTVPMKAQPASAVVAEPGAVSGQESSRETQVPADAAAQAGGTVSQNPAQASSISSDSIVPPVDAGGGGTGSNEASSSTAPRSTLSSTQSSSAISSKTSSSSLFSSASSEAPTTYTSSIPIILGTSPLDTYSSHSSVFSASSSPPPFEFLTLEEHHHSLFARQNFGYSVPLIEEQHISTPRTVSLHPTVILVNLLLAVLLTFAVDRIRKTITITLRTAPKNVQSFVRRLPLSAAVFLVVMTTIDFLVPHASAQEFFRTRTSPMLLVPFYGLIFFVVAGATNAVLNNALAEEAHLFERWFLPANATHQPHDHTWKRSRGILAVCLLFYVIIGAYINADFSLLPVSQPGIAIVVIVTTIAAAYARDGMRFAIARARKWHPWLEANVLGLLLASASVWITRTFEIEPGYLIGVPAAVFIASSSFEERAGPFEWAGLLGMLTVALIAWLLLPFVETADVIGDLLRLLILILIETCFFESLPLPYLAGETVYHWNKRVWALQCTLASFLALHLLSEPASAASELMSSPPHLMYIAFLVWFVVAAIVLVGYCRMRKYG